MMSRHFGRVADNWPSANGYWAFPARHTICRSNSQSIGVFRRQARSGLNVMSIERICQREVDLADADESVRMAAERMHQRSVGTLVIVDEWRHPIGIVTDRDLVIRVLAAAKDPDLTLVEEVMTHPPFTVTEGTPIEDAIKLMRSGRFRRVPVV